MNENNNMRVITLADLWDLFIQRAVVILLAAAIAAAGLFAVDMAFYRPRYASTATLYILRQNSGENTSSGEAANELSLALRLVYDCNYFLKSRTVLGAVIEELDLDMTYSQLYSRISTVNPTNTRIMEITVQGDTPQQAEDIVNKICTIGPAKIEETMGFSQLNLYEKGNSPTAPCNRPGAFKYMVVGLAAAIVVYAFFLLIFILDDRLRTEEDIERTLGLSVLAEIPNTGSSGKGRYAYFKGGGKYYGNAGHAEKRS